MSASLEFIERVIPLIRPKFYNRLTWVVVLAGVLLTAAPWWADLVNALAQKYFAVALPPSTANVGWGIVLIGIGLVYHVVVHSINELVIAERQIAQHGAHLKHDQQVFANYQSVFSEQELLGILEQIGSLHMYWSPHSMKFSCATTYLLAPSTQFITTNVQSAAREFATKLHRLNNFLGQHFFEYNSPQKGDLRFCMYPDLNPDRARRFPTSDELKRYDDFADQLNQRIDETVDCYKQFRGVVKLALAV